MPFWRKSEDPWDMEPEKRRTWTAGEPQPPAADGEAWKVPGEKETAEEQTPSAMTCPWCGQEMRMGYLVGGRDAVRLVWERPGAFRLADADGTLYLRGDGTVSSGGPAGPTGSSVPAARRSISSMRGAFSTGTRPPGSAAAAAGW